MHRRVQISSVSRTVFLIHQLILLSLCLNNCTTSYLIPFITQIYGHQTLFIIILLLDTESVLLVLKKPKTLLSENQGWFFHIISHNTDMNI